MKLLPLLLPCALLAAPARTFQEFRAPNGLRVMLDERHDFPVLRLELRIPLDLDGADVQACASEWMGAALARCGAGGFNRLALERTLAERGLRLELNRGERALGWTLAADSQDQEEAFAFLAHAVFRPALAEGVTALQQEGKCAVTPEDAFRSALGLPSEGITTCDLDLAGLLALHRRLVRPDRAVLVVQGDVSLLQLRQLVILHLGTWAPAAEPTPASGKAAPEYPKRQVLRGSGEEAWAGSPVPTGKGTSRAAQVLLALWLERTFREGSGEAIGVEAPHPDGDAGPILFHTLPGVAAPERVLRERLERLRVRGMTAEDLAWAKTRWRAERAALALHPEEQLSAWSWWALAGDPGNALDTTGLEAVNAALQARLAPEVLHWLVKERSSR